jgi:hypothetical protein
MMGHLSHKPGIGPSARAKHAREDRPVDGLIHLVARRAERNTGNEELRLFVAPLVPDLEADFSLVDMDADRCRMALPTLKVRHRSGVTHGLADLVRPCDLTEGALPPRIRTVNLTD